ncbi:MAG: helical backbone metal receptor, partial [Candidatus Aminicenantes bacterium]|nr:helical backbone metal receptor [Candidatus Aminicenantes bacterium]
LSSHRRCTIRREDRGHVPEVHVPIFPARVPLLALVVTALSVLVPTYLLAGEKERGHVPGPAGLQAVRAAFPRQEQFKIAETQDLKDDLGRPFPLPERTPERIVSMAPNITEILFALGLGDRVAGVTRFCDYPPEARYIRRIGGLVDPNIEIIQSLDPGLVIAFRGNPLRLVDRIRKLGLPVFVLDIGQGLEALFPLIAKIGRVTRSEERAAALAAGLRRRLEAMDAAMSRVGTRPKVFVLLYGQGLWTCGGESYVDDLISRAGGTNVASPMPKKWVLYKREQILEDDPDVIFILARSREDFATGRDWLQRKAHVESVAAVRSGRIFELDENAASRFGPRLVDVLDRMARLLHPELFGDAP